MDLTTRVSGFHMKGDVVYYDIVLLCRGVGAQWEVEKRYSEFDALVGKLKGKYPEVPQLPPKTLVRTKDEEYLRFRKEELERFLRDVCRRRDLVVCEEVRDFLSVDSHVPEAQIQLPSLFFEEHISKPISSAYITPTNLIFTQYEHMTAFRIDAYISRINIPFLKQERQYVGYTEIHKRTDTGLELQYRVTHDVISTILGYSEHLSLVMVGFENGEIQGYLSSSLEPAMTLNTHTAAVRGLLFSPDSSQVISVADDKLLVVMNLSSRTALYTSELPDKPLQLMWWKEKLLVTFAASLGVYSLNGEGLTLVSFLTLGTPSPILSATAYESQCYLGTSTGSILIYNLLSTQEVGTLMWQGCITALVYSPSRKELMAGNDKGQVATFSTASGALLNVMTVDFAHVAYLGWDEASQLLFTSGVERKLRVYRMPASWQILLAESLTDTVEQTIKKQVEVLEDLEGWDR